jgi:hypothetical protein
MKKKNETIAKASNPAPGTNHLSSMMQLAVPLWIERMKAKGGPDDEDRKKAQETSNILGERGDILLCGGGKKGEVADQFNRTAYAVATLAFVPGGVTIFGSHFEATV